jgi:hypothetical protein
MEDKNIGNRRKGAGGGVKGTAARRGLGEGGRGGACTAGWHGMRDANWSYLIRRYIIMIYFILFNIILTTCMTVIMNEN